MKFDMKKLALGVGLVGLLTLPASAELVAGWDFSDLSGDSAPVPGGGYAANYAIQATASSLNVTGDVVASTLRPGASVRDDAGLQGGINGYSSATDPSFPAGTTSFGGGELLGLTARGTATLEFDTSLAATPTNEWWVLTLGAAAISPTLNAFGELDETQIDIAFGATCGSAASVASVTVSPEDTEVKTFLAPATSAGGCVVLDVDGSSVQPLIDNVALSTVAVPEPGLGALLVSGVAGLLGLARRRA
jgi:hypothetical protein